MSYKRKIFFFRICFSRWEIMYGVFNVGTFTFINVLVVSCFNFKLRSFFPCRKFITLIFWFLTAVFTWCNKALYTITNKGVDNDMLILRMFFRNLRFSRRLFFNSVPITKRAILYVSFRIDTLTLANVGISCSFLHNFINAKKANNFQIAKVQPQGVT